MTQWVAMFIPALLAAGFINHLKSYTLNNRSFLLHYGLFVVLINLFAYLITLFLFGNEVVVFTDRFFVKYLLLALGLSIVLPLAINMLATSVTVEVKQRAKKSR